MSYPLFHYSLPHANSHSESCWEFVDLLSIWKAIGIKATMPFARRNSLSISLLDLMNPILTFLLLLKCRIPLCITVTISREKPCWSTSAAVVLCASDEVSCCSQKLRLLIKCAPHKSCYLIPSLYYAINRKRMQVVLRIWRILKSQIFWIVDIWFFSKGSLEVPYINSPCS